MNTSQATSDRCQYTCGRCAMFYHDYKLLLEHLYWKHGTESRFCNRCSLKTWNYAAHVCNVLPTDHLQIFEEYKYEYCLCGKDVDSPMIGCDDVGCKVQWYHFSCVGVVVPPDGDWYCPDCKTKSKVQVNLFSSQLKS